MSIYDLLKEVLGSDLEQEVCKDCNRLFSVNYLSVKLSWSICILYLRVLVLLHFYGDFFRKVYISSVNCFLQEREGK